MERVHLDQVGLFPVFVVYVVMMSLVVAAGKILDKTADAAAAAATTARHTQDHLAW